MTTKAKAQFLKDTGQHVLEIVTDSGITRHLKFKKPGTGIDSFQLVTWPGYLAFTGDRGAYVFSRLPDMFDFFRTKRTVEADGLFIDTGYWASKCVAEDKSQGVERYSEELAEQRIREALCAETAREDYEALAAAVEDEVLSCLSDGEHELHRAVDEFEWHGQRLWTDTWEWDFKDYTYSFVWCCYAITWGIRQYDQAKEGK